MLIDKKIHDQKFLTAGRNVHTPKYIDPLAYYLPKGSVIHFIPPSTQIYNMDMANSFTRNCLNRLYLFNIEKLIDPIGNISNNYINLNNTKRQYLKTNPNVREIKELANVKGVQEPVIANYSYLLHLFKYSNNSLILYQEWFDVRTTMWKTIEAIGPSKIHFIRYTIPDVLPTKIELATYVSKFTTRGLELFNNNASLDLLELWRIMHDKADSPDKHISEDVKDMVYFTFCMPGKILHLSLRDFISEYSSISETENTVITTIYTLLDKLFSLNTTLNTKAVIKEASSFEVYDFTPDIKVEKQIEALALDGKLSYAEQKPLLKLATKYKTIQDPHGSGLTLDKMVVDKKDLTLPNKTIIQPTHVIHDDSIYEASLHGSDEEYIKNVLPKDITQAVLKLHDVGIIVKDLTIHRTNSAIAKTNTYSLSVQPLTGPASTLKFTLPVVEKDGTFLSGGVKFRLDKQIGELPICKISPSKVALTSYFGKTFILRNQNTVSNYEKYILKVLTECSITNKVKTVFEVKYGTSKIFDDLPRKYTAIACSVKSFKTSDYIFLFNYNKINELYSKIEVDICAENSLVPVGRGLHKSNLVLGMDKAGVVYSMNVSSSHSKSVYLGELTHIMAPDEGYVDVQEFTEIALFSKHIPLILVLAFKYGLSEALSRLKITYEILPVNTRIPTTDNVYVIKFKDVKYKLHINTPELMLLVSGIKTISKLTPSYRGSDFDKGTVYNTIMSHFGASAYYLREITLMFDMFIDPITMGLLEEMGEPTDFFHLLLRANDMLVNDYRPKEVAVRYKQYERLAGAVYKSLTSSVRAYRQQGNNYLNPVGMPPKEVFLGILKDQSVVLVEEGNPIHNLKEQESVTYSGVGGRSTITMTKSMRAFNESDIGIVSDASPDSAKVGIRFYLTSNPNIKNLRGIPYNLPLSEIKASSALSTTSNITPGVTHDDAKRVNHLNVHHGHGVSCVNYVTPPYRTGFEETVGSRSSDLFCINADESGVVTDIKNNKIIVKYNSGETKVYKIGKQHGVASGVIIPHTLTAHVKVGQKLKEGDVIAYNEGFFKPSILNQGNVAYASGILATVALLDNVDTNEDGCLISKETASRLGTPSSKLHPIVIDFDKSIYELVTIGTTVEVDDNLCVIENSQPDELDVRDASTIRTLSRMAANTPKAKTYGVVSNIEVLYNGDIDDMNITLQQVVRKYDSIRAKEAKEFGDDRPRTGKIDDTIRVGNKTVEAGQLVIKVFIDYTLDMGVGDKVVFAHILKGTVSTVSTAEIVSEHGVVIDAFFGGLSVGNRIVESPIRTGLYNAILEKMTEVACDIYFGT